MNKINEIGAVAAKDIVRHRERTPGDVLATKRGSKFGREFKSGHERQEASLKFKQRNRKLGAVNRPLIFRQQGIQASTRSKYSILSKLLSEALAPSEVGRKTFFKEIPKPGRRLRPWVTTPKFNEPKSRGFLQTAKNIVTTGTLEGPEVNPAKAAFNKNAAAARSAVTDREQRLTQRSELKARKSPALASTGLSPKKYPTLGSDTRTPEEKPGMDPISSRDSDQQGTQQRFVDRHKPKARTSGTGLAKRGALRPDGGFLSKVRDILGRSK